MKLDGKRALIAGIANDQSIAFGCARALKDRGVRLAVTYASPKAETHVRPWAEELGAELFLPMDVRDQAQVEHVFGEIGRTWGGLDIMLHSIAFCPKEDLHGRVVDSSAEGFAAAMDISCHSFMRMARLAEPLMTDGGTLLCVSFFGAVQVVPHYGLMGPVKAALECATRYMASELAEKEIRVHALSPGPIPTRAASGIGHFEDLAEAVLRETPTRKPVTIEDVGAFAAFLSSDAARNLTGGVHYVDGGHHIMD